MKFIILACLIAIGGFFIFHKQSPKSICPLNNANILTIGDSLANGYGVDENDSFAIQVPKILNKNPIKRGINGETTIGLLARIDRELQVENLAAIIISIGGNDFLKNVDKNTTKRNLDLIVEKAKAKNKCVVLLGVPDGVFNGLVGGVSSIYTDAASKYGVLLESKSMPEILKHSYLKVDQIHPNKEGHSIIAKNIVTLIKNAK